MDGKEDVLRVFTYLVDADVPFLCGKRTMLERLNKEEFQVEGDYRKSCGDRDREKKCKGRGDIFAKEGERLDTFKAIRKVHEVTNHKSAEQLIISYRNGGIIGPETVRTIRQVVKDCKICQKFGRSMVRPKVALPRVTSFNEIVTLDLKQFGNKYVL